MLLLYFNNIFWHIIRGLFRKARANEIPTGRGILLGILLYECVLPPVVTSASSLLSFKRQLETSFPELISLALALF